MKNLLQRCLQGITSGIAVFMIMAAPVVAIAYASELLQIPESHEVRTTSVAQSQPTILSWIDKVAADIF